MLRTILAVISLVVGLLVMSSLSAFAAAPPGVEELKGKDWEPERHIWTLGTVDPDVKTTFRIMSWESQFEFRKWYLHIERFFEKYYPNVEVKIDWGVEWGTYWTKLPTMLAAGDIPDLIWMHDTRVVPFASKNMLIPLDAYIEKLPPLGWTYDWYESQVSAFSHEGRQYGIPYDFAPGGFYINKTMFEEAGVKQPPAWSDEWTWDDVVAASKKLTRDTSGDGITDQFGVDVGFTSAPHGTYWAVREFGGEYVDPETLEVKLDDSSTVAAVQFLADLRHKLKVAPPAGAMGEQNPFVQGIVGMFYSLNDEAFAIEETVGDQFEWGLTPSPTGPAGRFQFVGGSALAIPRGAKNPDLAYELIRYGLSNPERLPISGRVGSQLVARKSFAPWAVSAPLQEKVPNYHYVFSELGARDGVVPYYHEKFQEFAASWTRFLDPVFVTGEMTAEDALDRFQQYTERLVQGLR